ncbi:TfoX/Sxy family protein [Mangrovimonas sp. TPBH4]|uniref:TfoX/Sxy family protein n=1 Tax=Mangrovimonas sp. TPBH4 TaxID=1645914 RepID=UPI0006B47FAB|nr:TfoX/Sxy family protein [Mangrovimonas sp. TPBH4]
MAYDDFLAERIKTLLMEKQVPFEEKKMMGGLCYMVDGKMCLGVSKDKLMARIGPEIYDEALSKKGCREMDFTGRSMKGFVFVEPEGLDMEKDLEYWVQLCLDYNPEATSSKKRK